MLRFPNFATAASQLLGEQTMNATANVATKIPPEPDIGLPIVQDTKIAQLITASASPVATASDSPAIVHQLKQPFYHEPVMKLRDTEDGPFTYVTLQDYLQAINVNQPWDVLSSAIKSPNAPKTAEIKNLVERPRWYPAALHKSAEFAGFQVDSSKTHVRGRFKELCLPKDTFCDLRADHGTSLAQVLIDLSLPANQNRYVGLRTKTMRTRSGAGYTLHLVAVREKKVVTVSDPKELGTDDPSLRKLAQMCDYKNDQVVADLVAKVEQYYTSGTDLVKNESLFEEYALSTKSSALPKSAKLQLGVLHILGTTIKADIKQAGFFNNSKTKQQFVQNITNNRKDAALAVRAVITEMAHAKPSDAIWTIFHQAITDLKASQAMAVNFYSAIDQAIINQHKNKTKYRFIEPTWKTVYILKDADESSSLVDHLNTEMLTEGNLTEGLATIEAVSFCVGYIAGGSNQRSGNQLNFDPPYVDTGHTVTFTRNVVIDPTPPELIEVYQTLKRLKAVQEDVPPHTTTDTGTTATSRKRKPRGRDDDDDFAEFFSSSKRSRKWEDWPGELKNGLTMAMLDDVEDQLIGNLIKLDGTIVYKHGDAALKNFIGPVAPNQIIYVTNRNSPSVYEPKDQATIVTQYIQDSRLRFITYRRTLGKTNWTNLTDGVTSDSLSPAETLHVLKHIDANQTVSQDVRDTCASFAATIVNVVGRLMADKTEDADPQTIVNRQLVQQIQAKAADAESIPVQMYQNKATGDMPSEWTWCVANIIDCLDSAKAAATREGGAGSSEPGTPASPPTTTEESTQFDPTTPDTYTTVVEAMAESIQPDTAEFERLITLLGDMRLPPPPQGFIHYCITQDLFADTANVAQLADDHDIFWKLIQGFSKLFEKKPTTTKKSIIFLRHIALYMTIKQKTRNSTDLLDYLAVYVAASLTDLIREQATKLDKLIQLVASGGLLFQLENPIFQFAILAGLMQQSSKIEIKSPTGQVQTLSAYAAQWLLDVSRRYRLPDYVYPTVSDEKLRHAMVSHKLKTITKAAADMDTDRYTNKNLDEATTDVTSVPNVSSYIIKKKPPQYAKERIWDLMKAKDFDQGMQYERLRLTTVNDKPHWDTKKMKRAFLDVAGLIVVTDGRDAKHTIALETEDQELFVLSSRETEERDVEKAFEVVKFVNETRTDTEADGEGDEEEDEEDEEDGDDDL